MRSLFTRRPIRVFLALPLALVGFLDPARTMAANGLPFDFSLFVVDPGAGAREIHVGDVDGDGFEDVVLLKIPNGEFGETGSIVVQFGKAGVGISDVTTSATTAAPRNAILANIDGAGLPEIVVAHRAGYSGPGTVRVWRVQPDRSLAVVATLPAVPCAGCDWMAGIAAGDFDGDGDLDLAASDKSFRVHLFRNDGGNAFPFISSIQFAQATTWDPLVAGDWDGDGRTDLAFAATARVQQYVFAGPPFQGSFRTLSHFGGGGRLEVVDLDGNGLDDLLWAGTNVQVLHSYPGALVRTAILFPATDITSSASSGDLDGDGLLDIVVATASRNVLWLRNLGATYAPAVTWKCGGPASDIAWKDLDGDGHRDPIVCSWSGVAAVGRVTGAPQPVGFPTIAEPSSVEIGDFDGDGGHDFAVLDSFVVAIHGRQPDGTWPRTEIALPSVGRDLVVADIDDDGASDLVILTQGFGVRRVIVRRADGSGGFLPPVEFQAPGASTISAADLDRDGDLDLLAIAPLAARAWPFLGDGNGGFSAAPDFAIPVGASDFVTLDVDDDGRTDLVTADGPSGTFSIFRASGPGLGFTWTETRASVAGSDIIEAIDANRDGRTDFVLAGASGSGTAVVLHLGPNNLSPPIVNAAAGPNLKDVRAGYIDKDRFMDLVALGKGVHFLRSRGDGTFEHQGAWFAGDDERAFAFDNFVPGAEADVLVTYGDGTVRILANPAQDLVGVTPVPSAAAFALRISPSPATGPFRVELAGRPHADARVEIFAVDGRRVGDVQVVRTGEDGRATLVVPAPGRAGVYLVRAVQDGREVVQRAVSLN